MKHEHAFIQSVFAEIYKPRDLEPIADWAKRCLKLPTVEGEFAALPYDVARTPLVRHFFDWWQSEDSTYTEYVDMKGSQSGRTLGAVVASSYDFSHEPHSTMYLTNTAETAAAVGKIRFVPMLRQAAPEINDAIDDSGDGAVFKVIKGALFICTGGTVPTRLQSWPLRRAHIDEAALHRSTEAGTTMDLATKRTEKQSGRKVNIFSKPEAWPKYRADPRNGSLTRISGDNSIFTERWMSGTQCVPMVPCPHCNGFQELNDEQLKAPPELLPSRDLSESDVDLAAVEATTWYECFHCQGKIYDHQKAEMVRQFDMRPAPIDPREAKAAGFARPRMIACDPRHPEINKYRLPDPGVFSLHESDLYNIFAAECSFGRIHRKRIAAKRDPEKWAIYCKDIRGEPPPEVTHTAAVTPKLLSRLKGTHFKLNCVDPQTNRVRVPEHPLPCDPLELTIQIDYQQGQVGQASFFPYLITAFDEKWQSFPCDWGVVFALEDLWDLMQTEFTAPNGQQGRITFGLMDSQHDPTTVIEFCLRNGIYGRLFPSRGVSKMLAIERADLTAKSNGLPFWAYNYKATYWESQLYQWQLSRWCEILDPSRIGALHTAGAQRHAAICPRMFLPVDTDEDFYDQCSNMHETWKDPNDPAKGLTWEKIHSSKPNDLGDTLKLSLICRKLRQNLHRHGTDTPSAPVNESDAAA